LVPEAPGDDHLSVLEDVAVVRIGAAEVDVGLGAGELHEGAGGQALVGLEDDRQGDVPDLHQGGRIHRLGRGPSDDDGDRLADEPHAAIGQDRPTHQR
jgi:hypothetical protein